ncbi:arylesterase [Defluviimonas sp. WL0002]|uniref:Arylesterase n=1 Tax=Albidovulum marisflavi TaxID=2984159 RepID=A0ABT2Z951_9RHOB|nr:arylesterase [Defluviimonas sp. WL0002]MCV2867669.1 arylesterase [Defluviimonas sp. WL0002]
MSARFRLFRFVYRYGHRTARCNLAATLGLIFLSAVPTSAEPVTVVALGDSLTAGYGLAPEEGFVAQLQDWLDARGADASVINAGVSGDTTAGGLARTDWALVPETDAVIVTLGGNDLLRGLPPGESRANLDAILKKTDARGLPVLLVPMIAPGNYGPDYKAEFDAIYPDLANAHGARLAPPFLAPIMEEEDRDTALREYMQPDGLHPSRAGVALIVDALGPEVLALIEKAR